MKYTDCLLLFFLISLISAGCAGPQPWVDDFAVMPTDQEVIDIPIPTGFEYLETRSYSEEDPVNKVRWVRLCYRGKTSPAALSIELEREMVKQNWKVIERTFSGKEHTLRFGKLRHGGDNRKETCDVLMWRLEGLTFVKFNIRPDW